MSKQKHPANARKSKRGHRKENVVRFRLKKELIRLDADGNEILPDQGGSAPVNTFDRNWLSNHLNRPDVSGPVVTPEPSPPPPDNVTSMASHRQAKASKPVSQSGNEAESRPQRHTSVHGWLHSKSEAISDFRHWSRLTKEIGRNRCGSDPWVERENGKLSSPFLERARAAAQNGHKGLMKPRFKKAPSTVHNPFLNPDAPPVSGGYAPANRAAPICVLNQRNRNRDTVYSLAPSGIPISEFITGKYKPIEKAVVYTTELPPTPTRDWRAKQDNSVQVRKTPDVSTWVYKTNAMVQWFINHVEVQNWPGHVHQFVTWKSGGPIPNTGAINKAASHPETELILIRSLQDGLEKDWRMLDSALSDAASENNLLRQELELTKQELRAEKQDSLHFQYQLAQRTGDPVSAEEIRQELVDISKSKLPRTDDADEMLSQFNLFNSFYRFNGPEFAFARYFYGDPKLGQVIRDHSDMRCRERQAAVENRNMVRFLRDLGNHILTTAQAEYEKQKYDEYVNFWQEQYPLYLRQRGRRSVSAVREPTRESVALAAIARKGKPDTYNSSTYYSRLDLTYHDEKRDAVVGLWLADVKPTKPRFNNPRLVEHDTRDSWATIRRRGINSYEKWWAERLDWCEVEYQKIKHPVRVALVKGYNKFVDLANIPVDPASRKKQRENRERIQQYMAERAERREQRREERAEAKRVKAERDHIRKMQRIAH